MDKTCLDCDWRRMDDGGGIICANEDSPHLGEYIPPDYDSCPYWGNYDKEFWGEDT